MRRIDLTGQRFGRLVVLELAAPRVDQGRSRRFWRCQCDCGEIREVWTSGFPNTQSCGCLRRERCAARFTKHGHYTGYGYSPEAKIYMSARQRCTNPNHVSYKNYGGRGIEFRFESFKEFIEEIGLRPSPELTLDRIDNDGHYEAGNVRWATRLEQNSNRRVKAPFRSPVQTGSS